MGRTISSSTTSAASAAVTATVKTIDKVKIGDLVAMGVTGTVSKVSPKSIYPQPSTDVVVQEGVEKPSSFTTGVALGQYNRRNLSYIEFDTGERFIAYAGNGSVFNTDAFYKNLTNGNEVKAYSGTSVYTCSLVKLDETKFLFSYGYSNTNLVYRIVHKDGTILVADTTISVSSNDEYFITCNGVDRIVLHYFSVGNYYFKIIDYLGTEVLGATVLTAGNGASYTEFKFLTNGNIFAYYSKSGTGFFSKQFTKDGVAVGTELSISTSGFAATLLNGCSRENILPISDGVLVMGADSTTSYGTLYKIAFDNTKKSSILIASVTPFAASIIKLANGNILASFANSTSLYARYVNDSLVPITDLITINTFQNSVSFTSQNVSNCLFIAEAPCGFMIATTAMSSTLYSVAALYDKTLTYKTGSFLALNQSSSIRNQFFKRNGFIYNVFSSDSPQYPSIQKLSGGARSVIGAVQTAGDVGDAIDIVIEGDTDLNDDFSFIGSFDKRASTPYGNRGVIVGNKASFFGMKV